MRKINEWTRYLTVAVCVVQGGMWMLYLRNKPGLVYGFVHDYHPWLFLVMGLAVLTAGSLFLMWLGEQIDQYGIGNGVSLIITAGIVARMPDSLWLLISSTNWNMSSGDTQAHGPATLAFLAFTFVFVVAGSILLTQAQRRIRIQQAKHMRGRRVYGGQSQYLPLRVNHAGVMPIIFASSLMVFPSILFNAIRDRWSNGFTIFLANNFGVSGEYPYELLYVAMIFFFSYFWNTVQFNPKEIANQLRDYGSFIPGLRPGKRTADYLENVMMRITYVGSAFLAVIAVLPSIVGHYMQIDYRITQFLGGTGLLIVISVMLDLVNRIEANLVMRNYGGFLEGGEGGGGGGRVKRPRGGPVRTGPTQPAPSAFDGGTPKGLPT